MMNLARLGIAALAGAAALAWGLWATFSTVKGAVADTYRAGYTAGQTECALTASKATNDALVKANADRDAAEIARRTAEQEKERGIADVENRYRAALAKAKSDPELARCLAVHLPDGLQLSP